MTRAGDKVFRLAVGAAVLVSMSMMGYPAAADVEPRLWPKSLPKVERVPHGFKYIAKVQVRPWAIKGETTRIVARRGSDKVVGKRKVRLGAGQWKVVRTARAYRFTKISFVPSRGQCRVARSAKYEFGVACEVDGHMHTGTVDPYTDFGEFTIRPPVGADVADFLAEPSSWKYGASPPVEPELTTEGAVGAPIRLRDRTTVRVFRYNPVCVTDSEYRRLRLGMSKSTWFGIVGGKGTLEGRGSGGVEVRSYRGCSWSSLDGVTIRFRNGVVDAYARVS